MMKNTPCARRGIVLARIVSTCMIHGCIILVGILSTRLQISWLYSSGWEYWAEPKKDICKELIHLCCTHLCSMSKDFTEDKKHCPGIAFNKGVTPVLVNDKTGESERNTDSNTDRQRQK